MKRPTDRVFIIQIIMIVAMLLITICSMTLKVKACKMKFPNTPTWACIFD